MYEPNIVWCQKEKMKTPSDNENIPYPPGGGGASSGDGGNDSGDLENTGGNTGGSINEETLNPNIYLSPEILRNLGTAENVFYHLRNKNITDINTFDLSYEERGGDDKHMLHYDESGNIDGYTNDFGQLMMTMKSKVKKFKCTLKYDYTDPKDMIIFDIEVRAMKPSPSNNVLGFCIIRGNRFYYQNETPPTNLDSEKIVVYQSQLLIGEKDEIYYLRDNPHGFTVEFDFTKNLNFYDIYGGIDYFAFRYVSTNVYIDTNTGLPISDPRKNLTVYLNYLEIEKYDE